MRSRLKWPKPHLADDHNFKRPGYKSIIRFSTDFFPAYPAAIDAVFGPYARYARIKKIKPKKKKKNEDGTPPKITIVKESVRGNVNLDDASTSLVERQNLTLRTLMGRMKRKQLAFSKRLENLRAAVALYVAYYNYCWVLSTLGTTPAVAAGIAKHRYNVEELYRLVMRTAHEPWNENPPKEEDE
jgi:hypothetical protein